MSMQTYVSLLRGVNVGGRIVKMADLKACYEKAGFTDVTTLLQSGNVVFSSDLPNAAAVQAKLEAVVGKQFNYPAKILVYKQSELKPLAEVYPFDSSDENFQHYILFLRPGLAQKLVAAAADLDPKIEQVAPGNNVVYWRVQKGMTLGSQFGKILSKPAFKDFHTNRNLKTVRKLVV